MRRKILWLVVSLVLGSWSLAAQVSSPTLAAPVPAQPTAPTQPMSSAPSTPPAPSAPAAAASSTPQMQTIPGTQTPA